MIDTALEFVAEELNAHLRKRMGNELSTVDLGPVVDERGNWVGPMDTLRVTLFQIDEERVLRAQMPERTVVAGREVMLPPPIKLNLVLLLSARYQQYAQALRTLSHTMAFFQARPVFTPADSPALPDNLERLSIDLVTYGPEQLNQMWTCLGAKHLPSAVYRVRLVALQDSEPIGTGAPITTIETTLHGR
ncbi:DUF4255 domain-containing protein [Variovorax sp. KK3]|uniref:DUF4255 domain-containing protein n=1 Tax=Variovorax sp. KK3 TaxID=1855728 RepID=UPI00097C06B9|nr:DUF4255 domain-containing protein [Variovorax sp. KK3]